MKKLLVFQLSIQSSYIDNIERDADDERFDTVQWWFSDNETWRIKTFSVDQDIHTHCIAGRVDEEVAMENTMKHYEDVVERAFAVEFDDPDDEDEVSQVMEELGGAPALEMARNGNRFAFWNPSRLKYTSKSSPPDAPASRQESSS